MELKEHYTVAEVIEIVNTLSIEDKKIVEKELQKTKFSNNDESFIQMVKEDFKKYEATFKALA